MLAAHPKLGTPTMFPGTNQIPNCSVKSVHSRMTDWGSQSNHQRTINADSGIAQLNAGPASNAYLHQECVSALPYHYE